MTKNFDLGDVLSVSTGRLVSERGIEGIYDIMGYMTKNEGITTLGLVDMSAGCKESILVQHPQLAGLESEVPDWSDLPRAETYSAVEEWLSGMKKIYGESLPIDPIEDKLEYKSDLQIFAEIRGQSSEDAAQDVVVVVL